MAVWRRNGIAPPLEVRVAIIGNVDSGKSTLVGVMTRRYGQSIVNLVKSISFGLTPIAGAPDQARQRPFACFRAYLTCLLGAAALVLGGAASVTEMTAVMAHPSPRPLLDLKGSMF